VGLVSGADAKVGTATCTTTLPVSSTSGGSSYMIGIKVSGYYARDHADDNFNITTALPLTSNFITGGGYLKLVSSSGLCAGGTDSKNNFGFNVKYNPSGTNLKGNINTIVRSATSCTTGKSGPRVYQVKGNSLTSLGVTPGGVSGCPSDARCANFVGKANIRDVTNPLNVISVAGNQTLQVTMTDRGEPGANDSVAITVLSSSGGTWYSSNWDGTKTIQQLLGGGNLVVR
jgi:hypothetical protein